MDRRAQIEGLARATSDALEDRIANASNALERGDLEAVGANLHLAEKISGLLLQLAEEVGYVLDGEGHGYGEEVLRG